MPTDHDPPTDRDRMVSVVIATHHRPELLRAALAAVLEQRYDGPIEVIVVFDGTEPDRSLERDDPSRTVRVVPNSRTRGLAGGRNTGILEATGEYVAFCDDDDCWLPEKLALQVERLAATPECALAVSGVMIESAGRTTVRVPPNPVITHAQLLRNRITEAHPSSVVVRRAALLDSIGLVDEDIPGSYGEDYEWILRATNVTDVAVVQLPLVRVLWGATSFFQDRWQTIADAIEYLIARHPDLTTDRHGLARLHARRAYALAGAGERARGARLALRSLRLRPLDRRPYLALFVATGIVDAGRLMRLANRFGAGIV